MVVADLAGIASEIQLVSGKDAMKPMKLEDLEKYAYCPILKITPGVYARKAVIRVFIDKYINLNEMRRIKARVNK